LKKTSGCEKTLQAEMTCSPISMNHFDYTVNRPSGQPLPLPALVASPDARLSTFLGLAVISSGSPPEASKTRFASLLRFSKKTP